MVEIANSFRDLDSKFEGFENIVNELKQNSNQNVLTVRFNQLLVQYIVFEDNILHCINVLSKKIENKDELNDYREKYDVLCNQYQETWNKS